MNKAAIKNFAEWAREKLIADITYKGGMLGITENGIADQLPQSTADLHFYDVGTKNYSEISGIEIKQREALVKAIKTREKSFKNYKEAFENVVEEVAYTWFNRLVAIRFMEVNDYLPSGVRVLSSENKAKNEPDFVTTPFDTDLEFTPYEQDRVIQLKDENKLDELFRMLFIKQCNKIHNILPELFENTYDYSELLLTISFTDKDGIIYHLVHDIDENDFNVEKEGQVEIIGWLYQYYNTEPKDTVFANLKKNVKISKENIPAATQLFTPDWIVRYMVENSLGRFWLDGHPDCSAKSEWKYFLEEAEQEESVKVQLDEIRREYSCINPEQIKFIDPCMGSGHILVYAFDVLMQIYTSCGYSERDAAQLIIQKNLYGLDIDRRAYQLAYFALMMKARQYDRRFLTRNIKPNLSHFQDLPSVQYDFIEDPIKTFVKQFENADTYGSLINVEKIDGIDDAIDNFNGVISLDIGHLNQLVSLHNILSKKYDVVCTNPPYMGGSGMSAALSDFVKKHYPDSKSDLFAVFIERCGQLAKANGFYAMITQHAFMFLSSYEKLREKLLHKTTVNMAHLGARAFDEIGGEVVQTTAFVNYNSYIKDYKGTYARLVDIAGENEKKELFLRGDCRHTAKQENFSKIPGAPVAYWVSENFIRAFNNPKLSDYALFRTGMKTGDNDRFLRFWWECRILNECFNAVDNESAVNSKKKWFPYNKGGEFKKWYGNNDFVVNFENDGYEMFNNVKEEKRHVQNLDKNLRYKECITWTLLSSFGTGFRLRPPGSLYDMNGMCLFPQKEYQKYILGFANTKVMFVLLQIIAPTLAFQLGDVAKAPLIVSDKTNEVESMVDECVSITKKDWDSFETSWDFKKHPLI